MDRQVLQALKAVAHVLARRDQNGSTLEAALWMLQRELGLLRATLMRASPDLTELCVEAALDADWQARRPRYRRGEGITGRVLASGKPQLVRHIWREPAFRDLIHQRRLRGLAEDTAFVCTPVTLDGSLGGTFAFDCPAGAAVTVEEASHLAAIVARMLVPELVRRRPERPTEVISEDESGTFRPRSMLGLSPAMEGVFAAIEQAGRGTGPVLLAGEQGTGKELAAAAIHQVSARASGPIVKLSALALTAQDLRCELGGTSGASSGRIRRADGGTLYIDELTRLSRDAQVDLLQLLELGEHRGQGSHVVEPLDVRLICGTSRDLSTLGDADLLDPKLHDMLMSVRIVLPPLRERGADVLLLANHFVERYARAMGKPVTRISTTATDMIVAYHWPGNVGELEHCLQQAVLRAHEGVVRAEHLPPTVQAPQGHDRTRGTSLPDRVRLLERELIVDALKAARGNVAAAARDLGITPRMARYKIDKLEIDYELLFQQRRRL